MINKIKSSSLILWTIELLLVVSIIFICTKLDFIFSPIGTFFSAVFIPILIAGVLFYMLNPVVNLLMKIHIGKRNMSRLMAVILVFVLLGLLIFYITYSLMPRIITQVTNLFNNLPSLANDTTNYLKRYSHKGFMKNVYLSDYVNKFQSYIYSYAQKFLSGLTSSIGSVISMAASTVIVLITVPVMLFYMLKDGHKLLPGITKVLPPKRRDNTVDLLTKMSNTISNYIGGQMIECLFVGVFTSIGYILIGQKYALLLGCFAGICNIIPYVGPYIGIMPSLFVSLSEDITKVIAVIIVVLIVQQIDGNLVYPNVIGKSLNIHPLTIIIILLAAGNISGLLGMILAIPLYAVVKVIVQYVYSIWLLQREKE